MKNLLWLVPLLLLSLMLRVWGAEKPLFLTNAMALPMQMAHQPIYQPREYPSVKLLRWLFDQESQWGNHTLRPILYLYPDRSFVLIDRLYPIHIDEKAFPFWSKTFIAVLKLYTGLTHETVQEAHRILEDGGYLVLIESAHDVLVRSRGFTRLPFRFDQFRIYQKTSGPLPMHRHDWFKWIQKEVSSSFQFAALASPATYITRIFSDMDPIIDHRTSQKRILFIDGTVLVVSNDVKQMVYGLASALPFRSETFAIVCKQLLGLTRKELKEMYRVLEWGGFLSLRENIYDDLLRQFNFFKLPFTWGSWYVYQKRGTKPSGARHLYIVNCSA